MRWLRWIGNTNSGTGCRMSEPQLTPEEEEEPYVEPDQLDEDATFGCGACGQQIEVEEDHARGCPEAAVDDKVDALREQLDRWGEDT